MSEVGASKEDGALDLVKPRTWRRNAGKRAAELWHLVWAVSGSLQWFMEWISQGITSWGYKSDSVVFLYSSCCVYFPVFSHTVWWSFFLQNPDGFSCVRMQREEPVIHTESDQ